MRRIARIFYPGIFLLFISLNLRLDTWAVQAQDPTPNPGGMVPITDMMVPPPLPQNPSQADYGQQTYYYVCMACHGDRGQGLTPEWVAEWELEPNACWESKCHASNHPPEGFKLPRTIPGVIGPALTERFGSALSLHNYIKTAMPWHAPGSLSEEEYWNLTAFLLRLNNLDPGIELLDAERAAQVTWWQTQPTATPMPEPATRIGVEIWALGIVIVVLIAVGVIWANRSRMGAA